MIILGVMFLLIAIALMVMLWWYHQSAIMADIAKQEAEEYIEAEVDRRLKNADIRVKQQLYIVDEMGGRND